MQDLLLWIVVFVDDRFKVQSSRFKSHSALIFRTRRHRGTENFSSIKIKTLCLCVSVF